ncbi:MAG TPA: ComEC/Rec2 family competence protein [Solirubrobacterales bacterium]|nr:ComEC/Rec2 family competence protein [Solirubrobacterales bacterium]
MRGGWPSSLVVLGLLAVVGLALAHGEEIHARAAAALGRGMQEREAELARGFVLGEDDRIDEATVESFRRSGLAHLLAVSGQNVALLGLLAMPLLAALGMPLRARLVWILAAIAVYVPLTGAGPSILRAGVMGALGLLATLAGRRSSSLYALALAAIVTLAIDPRLGGEVGWQLSFAATLGIVGLAGPLRRAIGTWVGSRGWRGALVDGAAMTIAATLATAPLAAFHFEALSTTTLLANLLALPAVAPAMWLGMLVVAAGQVPGFPVELLNAVNGPLLAYIAQVAAWCGGPSWAYLDVRLGVDGLVVSYAALVASAIGAPFLARRCHLATLKRASVQMTPGRSVSPPHRACASRQVSKRWSWIAVVGAIAAIVSVGWVLEGGAGTPRPPVGLRVSILDVGQGDAILLQPPAAPAVLVDGGPPGDDLAEQLRAAGVDRLGAAIVTHEQSDHTGGIEELLGRFSVARLAYARIGRALRARAAAVQAKPVRIAAGAEIRSGALRLEALWPPRALLGSPLAGADPNGQALVLIARWHGFSMLLTGDAEAEAAAIEPGPLDVLKVAHHGSEDAGLGALLDRATPRLAVISVGAENPYGHPTASTLTTLAAHGVSVLRTDLDGTVVLDVSRDSVAIDTDS